MTVAAAMLASDWFAHPTIAQAPYEDFLPEGCYIPARVRTSASSGVKRNVTAFFAIGWRSGVEQGNFVRSTRMGSHPNGTYASQLAECRDANQGQYALDDLSQSESDQMPTERWTTA